MNIIMNLSKTFTFQVLALTAISGVTLAQETPTVPQTPAVLQTQATQRICSLDPVEDLLPPPQQNKQNAVLSYLAQEGFTQSQDGAWVCYANDPKKEGRYYTVFKVQEVNGKLIGSSFLDAGSLIDGQENRSIDFFMTLVERHMNASVENQDSIRRYLQAFVSLVKQGKIQPSRRGFLFDQPNRALVLYHTLTTGELKGTAITINIQLPKNLSSGSTNRQFPTSLGNTLKRNQQ
ncbi:hypothetical protein NIES4103_23680 [Nostoc sp. NIES-4103]|nr:hypothetical protein NIES4103_23680 [Nostoc sp. NIES-4103]